ncbi:hypothetical protein DXG01_006851 [Tephrocybe rancida]|nr:hypothetical protein DXG01_006851 [Tephrocybe rancida]
MPIYELPNEVLVEIFSYLAEWESPKPLRHRDQHVLTDVCRHWRQIALIMPLLWTTLFYDWKLEERRVTKRCDNARGAVAASFNKMVAINSYLKRAACHPLYLAFNLYPQEPADLFARMLNHFTPHIRNLNLKAPFSVFRALSMTSTSLQARSARFPLLEFCHLSMPYGDIDKASARKFTSRSQINFTGCSKMKELYVDSPDESFGFFSHNLIVGIPFHQMTSLAITDSGLSPLRARDILGECTSLVSCRFAVGQWEENEADPPSLAPITLPRLRVLIVGFTGRTTGGRISPFFRALTLPALVKLTISAPCSVDEDVIDELVRMQSRSCAPIRVLGLMNIALHCGEVPIFLLLLPLLRYLRIEAPLDQQCYSYVSIFNAIKYDRTSIGPSMAILPNLEEIFIADNLDERYTVEFARRLEAGLNIRIDLSKVLLDEQLLDAIESRCWRHGETPELMYLGADGYRPSRSLDIATMLWRNVPNQWHTIKRRATSRRDAMAAVFPIDIYLPLAD